MCRALKLAPLDLAGPLNVTFDLVVALVVRAGLMTVTLDLDLVFAPAL